MYRRESSHICIARAISLLILSLFLMAIATDLQSRRAGPTMVVENSPHNPEVPLGDVESDDDAPNPVMAESTLLLRPRVFSPSLLRLAISRPFKLHKSQFSGSGSSGESG